MHAEVAPGRPGFLATGEMARRIRAHDWAHTPLGPFEGWSERLKAAVDLMLAAPQPVYVAWGPESVSLYNDAYIPILGAKHQDALGRPYRNLWPEIWDEYRPLIEATMAGEAQLFVDRPVPLAGRPDRSMSWFTFSWTPMRDEAGAVAGFFCAATETTDEVLGRERLREGEERQAFLLKLSDALRPLADPTDIQGEATRLLREHFDVGWCYYLELNEAGTGGTILRDAHRAGLPSLVGFHDLSDIPDFIDHMATGRLLNVPDFANASFWSPRVVKLYTAMGVQSVLAAPLVKQGRPTAALIMVDTERQAGSERAVALISEVADRTWAALERARAETLSRQSEEKYRKLFERMGQGFALGKIVYDAAGNATDHRLIEINPAFEHMTGIPVAKGAGRSMMELFGRIDAAWLATFDRVVRSGKSAWMESLYEPLDRWIGADIYPAGDDQFIALYNDITERKRAQTARLETEERQAFLLRLSDDVRAQPDEDAIGALVAHRLAEHLRLDRCYLAQLYPKEDRVIVGPEYRRPDLGPASGEYRLSDFPEVVRRVQTQTVVLNDVAGDPALTASDKTALEAIGIGAFLTAGVRWGDERVLWALIVVSTAPPAWTPGEVALVENIAERTWAAIERARSEAALRERDERLRLVGQATNDAVMDWDLRSGRVIWSEAIQTAFGYADVDLEQPVEWWTERIHPDDRARVRDDLDADLAGTAEQWMGEYRFRRADGNYAEVVDRGLIVREESTGAARRVVGSLQDVSERRRAQAGLRESEERLRRFGEASLDILWIRNAETLQWTYLTPAFEAIYGLSRQEALTGDNYRVWQDLILPEDRARAVASIGRVGAGERVTFEYRIRRPVDGQVRWLRDTDFPMHDEAGRVARIGGVGHDVTAMKAVQAAMAESETRLRTLMEGIPQLVWRSGGDGLWTWASPQWQAFTGQSQKESHGWGWLDAVHPDDHLAAMQAWDEAHPHGRLDVEYRVRRASDGAWLWHRTRSVPVRDAPGPDGAEGRILEWLGTTTEIDHLKRLQGEQQVLVAELQHRTRNLLAVVRNVARRSIGASPERDEYDARLAAIGRVQGFLSRSPAYSVPLADVVEAELHAAGDGASSKVEVAGPPVDLPGESVQAVALALHELATNAVKYGAIAQPSAQLSVTWRIEPGEDGAPRLVIDWRESGVVMPDGPPARRGYGTELITRALPYQLRAQTALEFAHDGVRCRIILPASAFSSHTQEELV